MEIIFALQTSPVCYTLTGTKSAPTQSLTYLSEGCCVCASTVDYFRKGGLLFFTLAFDKRHVVDRQPPAVSSSYSLK